MNKIADTPILDTLPENIRRDDAVKEIAKTAENELREINRDTGYCLLIPRIEELSESLIDELAWEYHVDFYDQELPVEQKRTLLRHAIETHRRKGTPAAVQSVVSTILQEGRVEEWFEYGGEPYHFRVILIRGNMVGEETLKSLSEAINETKNVRSWIDYVQFYREIDGVEYFGGAAYIHREITVNSDISQHLDLGKIIYFGNAMNVHREVIAG